MSERKTSEIKLRIEPSVKAQWQQLAADEQIGLSELVVKAVTEYGRNLATHPVRIVRSPFPTAPYLGEEDRVFYAETGRDIRVSAVNPPLSSSNSHSSIAPKDVPTSGARGAGEVKFSSDWKPWDDAA